MGRRVGEEIEERSGTFQKFRILLSPLCGLAYNTAVFIEKVKGVLIIFFELFLN